MIRALLLGTATIAVAIVAMQSGSAEPRRTAPNTLAQNAPSTPAEPRAPARIPDADDPDDDLPSFEDYAQFGAPQDRERSSTRTRDESGPPRRGMRARFEQRRPRPAFAMCGPDGGRVLDRMVERMERITKPTEAQRPAFDKLKEAAGKAREAGLAGCPADPSMTLPGRLADAEKRLVARLEATRILRPAIEEYYKLLSDEQKARLYIMSPRPGAAQRPEYRDGRGDRWRRGDRRWRDDRDDDDERPWRRQWRGRS